ncbi:MAG: methylenetetrahydrofolate--tRNA-(uracil(54)-C(5))-methyltransferase (FADH(2)-oxidizing) TrmFO [Coriobacteriia bacterium]|nr:methylenetetrahydrofolate--tRNA-(uracil(54)-C(5))-methyltransferase (FADH(2)-oxidizing) TrmFO [Coriobacteriia bacterium]MBN2822773.1 methylenetetrahydrofolate--tRNA-(uracil(54)-C(5))-methyltransferase (FADH(2)-oxidizing) TrmFO [Coriobacteriia bacterium]
MSISGEPLHNTPLVTVIGGGLAGSEAAWQLAERGVQVRLFEMRPGTAGPAHHTGNLAELVCSNSFKGDDPDTPPGMLKRELSQLGSLIMSVARRTAVPAGAALAVDREAFSGLVTRTIQSHPLIDVIREQAAELPQSGPVIIATGPLTGPALEDELSRLVGDDRLSFYDAAAPIVDAYSIDRTVVFAASRYEKGEGADYLNCPMDREQYETFIEQLLSAQRVNAKEFESSDLFQACQPIEEIARRGADAARFGSMKPVGLTDPRTGQRPWAVVQLRPENRDGTAYNLVGFQTNLTFGEQARVFRLIPGLHDAEFLRFGVMHRNTYIDAPRLLTPGLCLRDNTRIRFAGQVSGTEGYLEAVGSGLLAALNVYAEITSAPPFVLPKDTALGALIGYATDPETRHYQPMHVNIGLLPALEPPVRQKRARYAAHAERARQSLSGYLLSSSVRVLDQARPIDGEDGQG